MRTVLNILLLLLVASCCKSDPAPRVPGALDGVVLDPSYSNGLSEEDRRAYWHADEGIQWLPYAVIRSLKRPVDDGIGLYDELFLQHPERLGMYPDPLDPNGPPIGLTVSNDPGYAPMAGINCSACHTTLLVGVKDGRRTAAFYDGGSSQFAVDRLIKQMIFATASTMLCPTEFLDFHARYRVASGSELAGAGPTGADEDFLSGPDREELADAVQRLMDTGDDSFLEASIQGVESSRQDVLISTPRTSLGYGAYPSESDLESASGMYVYLAKRLVFFFKQTRYASSPDGTPESGLGRSNPWSVTKNMFASNYLGLPEGEWSKVAGGPFNTPFMWDFDRQERIFGTGVTNSMLERNLAQGVALVTDFNWETLETTISVRRLQSISEQAKKARAPRWPADLLGPVDEALASSGAPIFKQKCLGCHDPMLGNAVPGSAAYNYVDVGTDAEYWKGQVDKIAGKDLFADILAPLMKDVKSRAYEREGVQDRLRYEEGRLPAWWRAPAGNAFGAKPLFGIWATAPFLHNGSVPSIRELLKKPADRVKRFYVGSYDYDPKALGFSTEWQWWSFELVTECESGCRGNSSVGHDYGTDLSEAEKDSLIEFLKSYGPDTRFD